MESIINQVSKMNKGTFGVEIFTETEPAMRKTNNPFVGRVKKLTHYVNAILGIDYQNAVNNRLTRSGNEANYQSEAPKGKKHYNAFFYQSLADESVFYLKIGMYKNTTCKSTYQIDGHEATQNELEALKPFLQTKSNNVQKQQEAGLNEAEQYHIVAPKASNVLKITAKFGKQTIYQRD